MGHKNTIPVAPIRLRLNLRLIADMDAAVQTGLFGHNRAQCAERLIAEGLRRLLKENVLKKDAEVLTRPTQSDKTIHR